jgi:hypothetical protein
VVGFGDWNSVYGGRCTLKTSNTAVTSWLQYCYNKATNFLDITMYAPTPETVFVSVPSAMNCSEANLSTTQNCTATAAYAAVFSSTSSNTAIVTPGGLIVTNTPNRPGVTVLLPWAW